MQFLTNLKQYLRLPHVHLRRRRHTSGEGVENGIVEAIPDSAKTYRILPIFSGLMIPFSIMLSIPSLTGQWYIRTENNVTTEIRPNPILLNVAMGFSMACAVLANAFLVVRFAERSIKLMTLASIGFLTLQDLISIAAVTVFGVIHRFADGFTYGPSFWFTVCSTIVSTATNITLIVDYVNTKDFAHSGSGLTQKQRSLVIIVIILLSYISIGSLIESKLMDITYINALYFSVVTIETIGYGDIFPVTPSARIFTCFYIIGGVMIIALGVVVARDAILESAVAGFRQRIHVRQYEGRLRTRWRAAVSWRLRERNLPTWVDHHRRLSEEGTYEGRWYSWIPRLGHRLFRSIPSEEKDPAWKFQSGPRHKRLNLEALTDDDLHAAALEAGAPLSKLVPEALRTNRSSPSGDPLSPRSPTGHGQGDPTSTSLTHVRLGGMLALVGNFAMAVTPGANPDAADNPDATATDPEIAAMNDATNNDHEATSDHPPRSASHRMPTITATMHEDDRSMEATLAKDVKYLFYTRLGLALLLFFIFWAAGSVIFMITDKWTFWSAVYFCFITFTTVGYGDMTPKTAAGRSIFVFWALLGVATMTILISVLMEAYTERYKGIIKSEVLQGTSSSTPRPQLNEHLSFASGLMDEGFPPPVPSNHPHTREVPADIFALSTAKLAMKPIKIDEGSHSRDDVDEKAAQSFQASDTLSQSILVQAEHLKSLITMARAQRAADDSQGLANLISQLESALHDFDVARMPVDKSVS